MADQDGLRFLFDIQDKITAPIAKIEARVKASAKNIDKAFSKSSQAQQANATKVIHTEKLRGIAVENAAAKATAARRRETQQGKILAQRLSASQSREARQAANFRIAAARRAQVASEKAERKIAAATKARARVAIKAEKDHERALVVRARAEKRASEASVAFARKSLLVLSAFGVALAAVSVKLVALGSAAEETENVTGLAFGGMKGAAEEWAASFAKSTGSSRFESIELVSDLGLIVKGMGFTEKASLGMSSRMVELAADMASAKNVPLAVALDKIRAGLIGESEPLRTMGVLLSEARVKQEAYTSGLAKTGTELTNTQKVQARMNIILEDSVAMHGDLINTQGSVANQWRKIKNQVFDAATAMGQKLLPIASKILGSLGKWIGKGADLITWLTESNKRMKVFGAILAGVVLTGLGLAAAALWAIVPALAAATGGISLLIPAIAAGVGALVAGFILFGKTIKDFLRKVWAKMLSKIGAGLKKLSKLVSIFSDDWAEAMADAAEGLEDTADGMAAAAKAAAKAEKAAAKLAKEQEKAAGAAAELAEAQAEVAEAATEAAEAAEEAAKAAAKEAKAVQDLADSWTGATLDSGKFLRAYQSLTPAQKENDRIMAQVLNKYDSLRKVHGPFNKELEAQWQATVRLNPELAALNKEQEKLEKAAQALNERLADQRRRLLGLPTDAARRAFEELTRVWDAMSADEQARGMENYRKVLLGAAEASHFLNAAQLALIESTETAKGGASGYDLALAGIAGEMGGATDKALNLVIAMREHNKAQQVAAAAGKKTEASFSNMQIGAGKLAFAFSAVGDAVGGTAGKIMTELGNIASAFATGGVAGGIMAGIGAVVKGLKSLFGRGKRRRARAAAAAKAAVDEAAAAAAKIAEAMAAIRRELLNLPTLDAVEDFKLLRDVWDAMNPAERAQGMENYAVALQEASAAGILLKDVEQTLLDAFVARNAALKAAAARQNAELDALAARQAAEMAGIDTQIDAIETRLRAKINELDALLKQQDAELDALSSRQDAELEALAARRQESLDAMTAVQNERLAVLKAAQAAELNALKAAQAEALSALKAARAAALGVIEAAIQRELEDERIAAQLIIDLRKAGGNQEAIDAAHARAATSTERLLERDELNDLMAEAEKRVRARYQDEIDTINAHFDKLETITTENFEAQQAKIEAAHADQLTAMEAAAAAERKEHNDHWDLLEKLMKLQHDLELKLIQEAHKAQLEELLASLKEQRQVLADGHAVELADLQSAHAAQLAEIERYWIAAKQAHEEGMAAINAVADRPPWAEGTGGGTGGPGGRYGAWWRPPGQQRPSDPVSPPGERQHGGPVRRGGLYLVGEGGPEMFVPSQSGRIEPHGSSGGGVDAKVLARAVADALEGTEIKVDGRKLGRLTVRHQPLAVAELGGRR